MTLDELRQRFREASHVLRRLPLPHRGKPSGYRVTWPDFATDWMNYGWQPARAPRTVPTPAEISRLDEALGWLHLLSHDQRMIVMARAAGWTWRKIEALDEMERDGHGRTERWLRTILGDGEARILAELNGTPKRMIVSLSEARAA